MSVPQFSLQRRLAALVRGDRALPAMIRSAGVQALIVLMNMVTGIITARLLGPDGRGVYAAVTMWPPLLGMLATAGLGSAVIVRLRRNAEARGAVAGAAWLMATVNALVIIGIGVLLLPVFMSRYPADVVLFAQACLVTVALNTTQIVIRQSFAGTGQYWYCNLMHLLPQLFHLLVLLAVALWDAVTWRTAAIALFCGSGLAVLAMLAPFVRTVGPRWREGFGQLRELASFSARAAPSGLVAALSLYSDRLVLVPFLPATELGFYAVAYSFSRVIQFVQPALQSIFLSHMSSQAAPQAEATHGLALRFMLMVLTAGCIVLSLLGETLLSAFYGAEFGASIAIFRWLVIEASLSVLVQITVQLYLSRERPGFASLVQTAMLAVSLGTLIFVVPRYGAHGAAVALAITGALRWLALLVALRPVLGVRVPRLWLNRADLRAFAHRIKP